MHKKIAIVVYFVAPGDHTFKGHNNQAESSYQNDTVSDRS